jgi:hypothetical protein
MAQQDRVIPGDDEELMGVLSLAANFLLMNYDISKDTFPEDAPDLGPTEIEGVIRGRLQEMIMKIQEQERRPYLLGKDLATLMDKVMIQCQTWLLGDFR